MAISGPTKEEITTKLDQLSDDELSETIAASKSLTAYYANLHTYAVELAESRDKNKPIQLDLF